MHDIGREGRGSSSPLVLEVGFKGGWYLFLVLSPHIGIAFRVVLIFLALCSRARFCTSISESSIRDLGDPDAGYVTTTTIQHPVGSLLE